MFSRGKLSEEKRDSRFEPARKSWKWKWRLDQSAYVQKLGKFMAELTFWRTKTHQSLIEPDLRSQGEGERRLVGWGKSFEIFEIEL